MQFRHVLLMCLFLPAPALAADPAPGNTTPPAFLDQVEGKQALAWVRNLNDHTFSVLQGDPRYKQIHDEALAIAQSHDRIPVPHVIDGQVYNLWQDAGHKHGIWRRTTPASFHTDHPDWHTVIDLDALSAREHKNWVWKGADCLEPQETRCMIGLSDGGGDAVTEREFDIAAGQFVQNGFTLPTSKQTVAWEDPDTLLVARDWGPGTMTASGYPFVIKRLKRGQALDAAQEIERGTPADITDDAEVLVDGDGHRLTLIHRGLTFFTSSYSVLTPNGLQKLDLPPKSTPVGLVAGRLAVKLDEDWQPGAGPKLPAGSLVSIDPANRNAAPMMIFSPSPRQSVEAESVAATRTGLLAVIYDNVRGGVVRFTPTPTGWSQTALKLPTNVAVTLIDAGPRSDDAYLGVTGFLTPNELWHVDGADAQEVKSLPAQFDATNLVVDQQEATSTDGTKIPYFIVHRRDMKLDGTNPTELTAYGGFGVSNVPSYSGAIGKLWLSRGGVYVLANIRGGGEFGPNWHEAGRKTHRQRVFDDFASVGRDLIARHITDERHLGIRGRSNGGLLMGVEFTQHPELWRAVIIGVPLLDMRHFETMAAGASWVDEYGSQSVPAEAAFLDKISPLDALRSGVAYPEPFIFTSTQDDRVGPVHARRFAWRLGQLGVPFLYYEDTEGGHSGTANLGEVAHEQALETVYLLKRLVD